MWHIIQPPEVAEKKFKKFMLVITVLGCMFVTNRTMVMIERLEAQKQIRESHKEQILVIQDILTDHANQIEELSKQNEVIKIYIGTAYDRAKKELK